MPVKEDGAAVERKLGKTFVKTVNPEDTLVVEIGGQQLRVSLDDDNCLQVVTDHFLVAKTPQNKFFHEPKR